MRDQIVSVLTAANLRFKPTGRYISSQCPRHDDKNPSAQIFDDGWVNCMGPCGRFHISKEFPELVEPREYKFEWSKPVSVTPPRQYREVDLYEEWEKLELIPRDHVFKKIPLEVLDKIGWRWTEGGQGMGRGYFIPYFSPDKKRVPFAQVRHLSGERRFSFLKDAKPTLYGSWNLVNAKTLYLVEGSSDGAVLEMAGVTWVAAPSSASVELVTRLADFCALRKIGLVYSGDNDEAGDKLKVALEGRVPFRIAQPPRPYKDWGDMLCAESLDKVVRLVKRVGLEMVAPKVKQPQRPEMAKVEDLPANAPQWIVDAVKEQNSPEKTAIEKMEEALAQNAKAPATALQRARKMKLTKQLDDNRYLELLETAIKIANNDGVIT